MKFKGSVTGFKRVAVCLGAGVLVLNMYRMPAIRPERFELSCNEIIGYGGISIWKICKKTK